MNIKNIFLTVCLFLHCYNFSSVKYYKEVLRSIIEKDPRVHVGIVIQPAGNDEPLYTQHEDTLLIPASCTKLFTAAIALHILGPEFCFKTAVFIDGPMWGDVLLGNLYIKASGDPSLAKQDLVSLIKKIKARGIHKIAGNVYIDTSVFEDDDDSYYTKGFCLHDIGKLYMQPVTSFIVDENIKNIHNGKKKVVLQPHSYLSTLIARLLTDNGVVYTKSVTQEVVPSKVQEIACHTSAPLYVLIARMLKESDNLYANALFKYLGGQQLGFPGTWRKGKKVFRNFLDDELNIQPDSYVIEDGAGLSRYTLLSPAQIVRLLTWVYNNKNLYPIFCGSLAQSGKDGTLKKRMLEYPGIVAAKTGTMHGISSLSGYICIGTQEPLIFSIILNGFVQKKRKGAHRRINYKRDIEDAICIRTIELVDYLNVSAYTMD